MEFVTIEELKVITSTDDGVKKLNEVLSRVYNQCYEDVIKVLPAIFMNISTHMGSMEALVKDLYDKNKDFVGYEELVRNTIGKVEGDNPGLSYEKMIERAIPKIKEGIKKSALYDIKLPERKPLNPSLFDREDGKHLGDL
jgi:hypothetical protein